jgi:hypothetical protein
LNGEQKLRLKLFKLRDYSSNQILVSILDSGAIFNF